MNEPRTDTVFIGFRVPLHIAAALREDCESSGDRGLTITEGLNNLLWKIYGNRKLSEKSLKWVEDVRDSQIAKRMKTERFAMRGKQKQRLASSPYF